MWYILIKIFCLCFRPVTHTVECRPCTHNITVLTDLLQSIKTILCAPFHFALASPPCRLVRNMINSLRVSWMVMLKRKCHLLSKQKGFQSQAYSSLKSRSLLLLQSDVVVLGAEKDMALREIILSESGNTTHSTWTDLKQVFSQWTSVQLYLLVK